MENQNNANFTIFEKTINLPLVHSSLGESAVDVTSLYKNTGFFTYDPGFLSTASCKSSITFIDGEKGVLMHRGYDISDLAENSTFAELFFALLYGDLPEKQAFQTFQNKLISKMILDEEVKNVILSLPKNSHPMAIMMAAISALSAKYEESYSPYNEEKINETSIDSVAKICTIASFVLRFTSGINLELPKPNSQISFEENLVEMMFSGTTHYEHKKILISAINKILILHADHEQNASTSTVRLVASTDVNIYASMVAGFAALWGPLHGGANEAVIEMLEEINSVSKIPEFIEKVKSKVAGVKLMGFGHRVYKNYDPRAAVLKSSCDNILNSIGATEENEILKIARELEKIALQDEYFVSRKLFPNVDFYSGIIYKALGMQSSFFTVVFGMARSAGWASQLKESVLEEGKRISRPRQVYVGEKNKKVK